MYLFCSSFAQAHSEYRGANAERNAQKDVAQACPRLSVLKQSQRFQRKCGERREAAADADLPKQRVPRIQGDALRDVRREKTERERAGDVDDERRKRKSPRMFQGNAADEVAQDRADKAPEPHEQAVKHISSTKKDGLW